MSERAKRDFSPRQQGASCNCLARQPSNYRSLEVWNIEYLHDRSRQLIGSWFDRAWQYREADGENSFEPFIFAWFSVNAWAACVTGEDSDSKGGKIGATPSDFHS